MVRLMQVTVGRAESGDSGEGKISDSDEGEGGDSEW